MATEQKRNVPPKTNQEEKEEKKTLTLSSKVAQAPRNPYRDPRQPRFSLPIRCLSCGRAIGHLIAEYQRTILRKTNSKKIDLPYRKIKELNKDELSMEGKLLRDMGVWKQCCLRMFLGQPTSIVPLNIYNPNKK